jgi:hypothetical protein
MTEKTINKKFDPSKYGLRFCPECKGAGNFLIKTRESAFAM